MLSTGHPWIEITPDLEDDRNITGEPKGVYINPGSRVLLEQVAGATSGESGQGSDWPGHAGRWVAGGRREL